MSVQSPFTFPLRGLGLGEYEYELKVDDALLASFPQSPVDRASIDLRLTIERRSRELTLHFDFAGTLATTCDRCTADIDLPIADKRRLVVKLVDSTEGLEDDADMVYLAAETSLFNVAPYVYEFVLLSVPLIKTYDCRSGEPPYPCDEELLAMIDGSIEDAREAAEEDRSPKASPWDILKDLN